jgi:hypothetical protein
MTGPGTTRRNERFSFGRQDAPVKPFRSLRTAGNLKET